MTSPNPHLSDSDSFSFQGCSQAPRVFTCVGSRLHYLGSQSNDKCNTRLVGYNFTVVATGGWEFGPRWTFLGSPHPSHEEGRHSFCIADMVQQSTFCFCGLIYSSIHSYLEKLRDHQHGSEAQASLLQRTGSNGVYPVALSSSWSRV